MAHSVFRTDWEENCCSTNVPSRPRAELEEEFEKRTRLRWLKRDILAGQVPRVAPQRRPKPTRHAAFPVCVSEVRPDGAVLWEPVQDPRDADLAPDPVRGTGFRDTWGWGRDGAGEDGRGDAGSMSGDDDDDVVRQGRQDDVEMVQGTEDGRLGAWEAEEEEDRILRRAHERDRQIIAAHMDRDWEQGLRAAVPAASGGMRPVGSRQTEIWEEGSTGGAWGAWGQAGEQSLLGMQASAFDGCVSDRQSRQPRERDWEGAGAGAQGSASAFLRKLAQVERLACGSEGEASEEEPGYKEQAQWAAVTAGMDECLACLPRPVRVSLEELRRKMPEQVALWALRKEREEAGKDA